MDKDLRQEIGRIYCENRSKGKPCVRDHLIEQGFSKSLIYKVMARVNNGSPLTTKQRSGRPKVNCL